MANMSAEILRSFIGSGLPELFKVGSKDAYMRDLVKGQERNIILSGDLPQRLSCGGSHSNHFALLDGEGLRLVERKPIGGHSQTSVENAIECFEAHEAIALFVIERSHSYVKITGYKCPEFKDLNLVRWKQWIS